MVQVNLNTEFAYEYKSVYKIVEHYLDFCWSCRNNQEHLRNHIQKKYRFINSETIRRTSQKIQNTEGRHQAEITTQAFRQAKQKWMEDNISKV